MKIASLAKIVVAFQFASTPVWAADDLGLERMATCQDSWLDWQKNDPAQLKKLGDHLRSDFSQNENDAFLVPKSPASIAGFRVEQVFPQSVGMGVGFSVTIEAPFDQARRSLANVLGKPLEKCDVGDNMRTCELEIGEKRTFVLMAEDSAKSATILLGCYYYYEK